MLNEMRKKLRRLNDSYSEKKEYLSQIIQKMHARATDDLFYILHPVIENDSEKAIKLVMAEIAVFLHWEVEEYLSHINSPGTKRISLQTDLIDDFVKTGVTYEFHEEFIRAVRSRLLAYSQVHKPDAPGRLRMVSQMLYFNITYAIQNKQLYEPSEDELKYVELQMGNPFLRFVFKYDKAISMLLSTTVAADYASFLKLSIDDFRNIVNSNHQKVVDQIDKDYWRK